MQRAATARVVFDVGANAGLYTLLAAAVNPNVEIHAFEPTSELVECLMDNLRLNNLKSVTVNPVAVCSYTGEAYLHRFTGGDNGDNDGTNFVNDDPQGAACRTKAVSLDEYCSGKGIQQIDLLKLDIEGSELDALAGARNLLAARAIGCIVVELIEWAANRAGHSTRDIKELLAGCGYGVYVLDGNALQPISQDAIHDGDNVIVLPSQSA
jgi:FkbM family methyltransferase